MKIVLVAPNSGFTSQFLEALKIEGHDVDYIDDRLDYSLPVPARISLLWRVSRRIPTWRAMSNHALQQRVLERSVGAEMLLATKGMNITPETLRAVRASGVRAVIWFADNAANEPYASWVRVTVRDWDKLISFDSAIAGQVGEHSDRTAVVPFGVDVAAWQPSAIGAMPEEQHTCDVGFIGAPYPDRVSLLSRVAGSCDLRIWGWKGWLQTPLAAYYRGSLDVPGSANAYRVSKICVNTNILPHARGVNLKTFEICAAGAFQLTDELPDLHRSFKIGGEVAVFHSGDDFVDRIAYWLGHEKERQQIAGAGYERVIRDHTLRERVQRIIALAL